MVKREIKIKIGRDGKVELDVLNGQGSSCKQWTKALEESLGQVVEEELKDSYYQEDSEVVSDSN